MRNKKKIDYLTTTEAIEYIADQFGEIITKPTLISWIKRFDLGYRTGGGQLRGFWRIYKSKLHKFLEANYGKK